MSGQITGEVQRQLGLARQQVETIGQSAAQCNFKQVFKGFMALQDIENQGVGYLQTLGGRPHQLTNPMSTIVGEATEKVYRILSTKCGCK